MKIYQEIMQILFNFRQLKVNKTVLRCMLWKQKNVRLFHVLTQVLNEFLSFFETVRFLFLTRAVSLNYSFKIRVWTRYNLQDLQDLRYIIMQILRLSFLIHMYVICSWIVL